MGPCSLVLSTEGDRRKYTKGFNFVFAIISKAHFRVYETHSYERMTRGLLDRTLVWKTTKRVCDYHFANSTLTPSQCVAAALVKDNWRVLECVQDRVRLELFKFQIEIIKTWLYGCENGCTLSYVLFCQTIHKEDFAISYIEVI